MKIFILISISVGLSACSLLNRSFQSGYFDYEESPHSAAHDYFQEKQKLELQEAKNDLGIEGSLTEIQKEALITRIKLKRAEKNIPTEKEREQYYKYKPLLSNDKQRLYFLSLPNADSRARWANQIGAFEKNIDDYSQDVAELIEESDIALGMTQKMVKESWGEPDLVEVAGNNLYGNEKWSYRTTVSSHDGYVHENRIIYFEGGRVSGWEVQ